MSHIENLPQAVESRRGRGSKTVPATERQIQQAVDAKLADAAARELRDLPTTDTAEHNARARLGFPFRLLTKSDATRAVVQSWTKNTQNIERVAMHVGNNAIVSIQITDSDWHPIQINTMSQAGTLRGISPKKTVVCIALGELEASNGLFLGSDIKMGSGQDVVLDGAEPLDFPGTGGGFAILILLKDKQKGK